MATKKTKVRLFAEQKQMKSKKALELAAREKELRVQLEAQKAKYEETMEKGLLGDKDVDKELASIQKKIEGTKDLLKQVNLQRATFATMQMKNGVTVDEVLAEWNQTTRAKYAEKAAEAKRKVLQAKLDYAKAVLAYVDIVNEAENEKHAVLDVIGRNYQYKLGMGGIEFDDKYDREKHDFSERDIRDLFFGNLPPYFEQIEQELKGAGE